MTQPESKKSAGGWPDEVRAAYALMQECPTCQRYWTIYDAFANLTAEDGMPTERWAQVDTALYRGQMQHQADKHPVYRTYMHEQTQRRAAAAANE